jgi:hypothetical protein
MTDVCHVDFYGRDWLAGTIELTLEQRGMLATAEALIYSRGGPVTREHLHRACGVHGRTFNAILGRLLALGKLVESDGKIFQNRAEKELKKARNRLEKWSKNLDNSTKPNGYDYRAEGNARAFLATNQNPVKNQPTQPEDSSPARAREAAPPEEAGLAGCSKISEEWIVEAQAERDRLGLIVVDLRKEAEKTVAYWRDHPPDYPHAAWLGRARRARPDGGHKAAPVPWVRTKPDVPDGPPPPFDLEAALAELGVAA